MHWMNLFFIVYSFYRLVAPSGNEFAAPASFFADASETYNAWDEFVFNRSMAFAGNQFGTSLFLTLCCG